MTDDPAPYASQNRKREFSYGNLYVITNQGTGEIIRLCNQEQDLTIGGTLPASWGGSGIFISSTADHQGFKRATDATVSSVSFTVVATDPRFQRYYLTAPTTRITLDVYRVNNLTDPVFEDDVLFFFSGELSGQAFQGQTFTGTFNAPSIGYENPAPRIYYQRLCNHDVYGPGCTLNAEDFKAVATITGFSRWKRQIGCTIAGDPPGEYFSGGFLVESTTKSMTSIVVGKTGTGTARIIYAQFWFPELETASTLDIYQGCPHTIAGCKRFGNLANFLGFPSIPIQNPSIDGVS